MSVTTTESAIKPHSKKRLEGVKPTNELLRLWKECYSQVQLNDGRFTNGVQKTDAAKVLKRQVNPNQDPHWVPFDVIQAMQILLDDINSLERALLNTSLCYTPRPSSETEPKERRKFRKRIARLRLQSEETKYLKLTNNLNSNVQDDDITGRSMTYAASVGLNMIIAPLSFGCFMYFFSGGFFDYVLGESFSARTTGGVDIKRVIVGVVSGVAMLFIEMILFVIRTHEFEAHQVKKNKKKGVQPFGVYTKKTEKSLPAESKQDLVKKDD